MSKNGCYESPCAVTGGTIRKELNTGLEENLKVAHDRNIGTQEAENI